MKPLLRNLFSFWLLGIVNNFHFCIVIAAADQIAKLFHLESYVALILWANVFFGIFVRILNTFVLTDLSYSGRIIAAGAMTTAGLLVSSISPALRTSHRVLGFSLFLVGTVFIGNGSSYGESVALGYIERFPSKIVAGWSSGTGLSGVAATMSFLVFSRWMNLTESQTFLIVTPLILVYWAAFFLGIVVPAAPSSEALPLHATCDQNDAVVQKMDSEPPAEPPTGGIVDCMRKWKERNWGTIVRIHNCTFWNNLNLAVVYVAEYAVQFMAPFAFPCIASRQSSKLLLQNSFVLSQLCYQLGVLCSRSSLLCVRIRRVSILTFLQLLNAVMWFVQAKTLALASAWHPSRNAPEYTGSHEEAVEERYALILLGWMFYVGLLGGASYVNVFFNILEMKELGDGDAEAGLEPTTSDGAGNARDQQKQKERELSMNIGALYAACGIAVGSIVDVLFTNIFVARFCDDRSAVASENTRYSAAST